MKKTSRQFLNVFARYIILVLVAIPNLWLFYFVFTPLTIYPVHFLLSLFFEASILGNIILIERVLPIQLIPACIAGAAYYLLLILSLSIPRIKLEKRLKLILFTFVSFLIINIIRIFLLSVLVFYGSTWFDLTHKLFWYALSTLFVIVIWFLGIKIFKIKAIPLYSDLKFLYKQTK